jgi:hypothetical protein
MSLHDAAESKRQARFNAAMEVSLNVLADNLKRMMAIIGFKSLIHLSVAA